MKSKRKKPAKPLRMKDIPTGKVGIFNVRVTPAGAKRILLLDGAFRKLVADRMEKEAADRAQKLVADIENRRFMIGEQPRPNRDAASEP